MSETKINAALIQGYQAAALGLSTGYEGKAFEPQSGVPHALVRVVPADTDVASLGVGGFDEHVGFLEITVLYPLDDGTGNLLAKVDAARAYFVAGRRLTYQGLCVRIRRSTRSAILRDGGWLRVVISVFYEANSIRPEV